jgi:biopolymer transport protein ExbB
MNFTLLQVAETATTAANIAAGQQPASQQLDYWELALKGGVVMIPILLLSVVAVFILVERFLAISRATKSDSHFMDNIREYVQGNRLDAAVALCQATEQPQARLVEKGLKRMHAPLADVQTAIENQGSLEVAQLERGLPILAMVAGGAPMLGFLGTVTGMVRAFFDMAQAGNNLDIQILANGIYEAMVTTVAGLIVGLVGYFSYNYLVSRVQRVMFHLEADTMEFMDVLYAQKQS